MASRPSSDDDSLVARHRSARELGSWSRSSESADPLCWALERPVRCHRYVVTISGPSTPELIRKMVDCVSALIAFRRSRDARRRSRRRCTSIEVGFALIGCVVRLDDPPSVPGAQGTGLCVDLDYRGCASALRRSKRSAIVLGGVIDAKGHRW